jgi:hypothetical protein
VALKLAPQFLIEQDGLVGQVLSDAWPKWGGAALMWCRHIFGLLLAILDADAEYDSIEIPFRPTPVADPDNYSIENHPF